MSSRKQSDQEQLPQELAGLERALTPFQPAASHTDRDRLMFEAGVASGLVRASIDRDCSQASASRRMRRESHVLSRVARPQPWSVAAAAAAIVACMFASLYLVERNRPPATVREVVFVEREPATGALVAGSHPATSDEPTLAIGGSAPGGGSLQGLHESSFLPRRAPLGADPTSNYVALRRLVLMRGIDALPHQTYRGNTGPEPEPPGPPVTARALMEELLPGPTAEDATDTDSTFRRKPTRDNMRGTT